MSVSTTVSKLDMRSVQDHYRLRESIHATLRSHFDANEVDEFVPLALGISNPDANYSAAEHGLGPRILMSSTAEEVFDCVVELDNCPNPHHLPELIYRQSLPFLKISVGTEIAMMLRPNEHWVVNVRSIWAYLLLKHSGNVSRANQELALYHDGERDSEMSYQIWRDIYLALEHGMTELNDAALPVAKAQNISPGPLRFLWADCVANGLYVQFAKKH